MHFYLRLFVIGIAGSMLTTAVGRAQAPNPRTAMFAGSAQLAADEPTLDLGALIRDALERNPSIRAAVQRVAAARLRPDQERKLADPMLSAGWNSSGNPLPGAGLGSEPTANIGLMVTQPLPYPGKRDLRAAVAGHEVDAEAQQLEALRLDVRSRVKQAYARLAYATSAIELLERNKRVIETLLSTTEARYSVGKTAQADVFKSQAELTAIELRLERFQHTRIAREAELNALTDRPANTAIGRPPALVLPEFTLSLETVLAAGARTPILRRDEAVVSRAAAAIDVARRDFKPDFAVSGGYYYMGSMPAMYMVRFDVELPLQRARRALALEERESTLGESRAGLEATRRAVESSIQDDYHMAMSEARLARIYRDTMLPQLRLAFESSLAAYETGAVDFLSVLTGFTGLLDQEMSYLESLSEYHVAIARLEAVTGATETP